MSGSVAAIEEGEGGEEEDDGGLRRRRVANADATEDDEEIALAPAGPDLKEHAINFMATTSAHGFNHLVAEEPKASKKTKWAKRIAWGFALLLAYSSSGYILGKSVDDANRNPITNIYDYISVLVRMYVGIVHCAVQYLQGTVQHRPVVMHD